MCNTLGGTKTNKHRGSPGPWLCHCRHMCLGLFTQKAPLGKSVLSLQLSNAPLGALPMGDKTSNPMFRFRAERLKGVCEKLPGGFETWMERARALQTGLESMLTRLTNLIDAWRIWRQAVSVTFHTVWKFSLSLRKAVFKYRESCSSEGSDGTTKKGGATVYSVVVESKAFLLVLTGHRLTGHCFFYCQVHESLFSQH